jgi:hypothetical protein
MRSLCALERKAGRKTFFLKVARISSSSGEDVSLNIGTAPIGNV